MNQDARDSLTALLAVLLAFCALYLLLEFPEGPVSWTASTLALLLLSAIVVLRFLSEPRR